MSILRPKLPHRVGRQCYTVEMDGYPFTVKRGWQPADKAQSKGSMDEPFSHWLTIESLLCALAVSGFAVQDIILDCYNDPRPQAVLARTTDVSPANAKVFVAAKPSGSSPSIQLPSLKVRGNAYPYDIGKGDVARYLGATLMRLLRKSAPINS